MRKCNQVFNDSSKKQSLKAFSIQMTLATHSKNSYQNHPSEQALAQQFGNRGARIITVTSVFNSRKATAACQLEASVVLIHHSIAAGKPMPKFTSENPYNPAFLYSLLAGFNKKVFVFPARQERICLLPGERQVLPPPSSLLLPLPPVSALTSQLQNQEHTNNGRLLLPSWTMGTHGRWHQTPPHNRGAPSLSLQAQAPRSLALPPGSRRARIALLLGTEPRARAGSAAGLSARSALTPLAAAG